MPDLMLYLGVTRGSLGEATWGSGGSSSAPGLSREEFVKNFLKDLGTICRGSVGCTVDSSFQSIADAPKIMGPSLSISLVLADV